MKQVLPYVLALSFLAACGCEKKQVDVRPVLKVTSNPKGALVFLDGKQLAKTPVRARVPAGAHLIKLSKPDYRDAWRMVRCAPKATVKVEVELERISAAVMVRSEPPGARVLVSGNEVGETPLILRDQPVGKQSAVLKKVNYSSVNVAWNVEGPRPVSVKAELLSNVANLKVTSTPSEAHLLIDDVARGVTPFAGNVERGTHKITLKKQGYAVHEEVVALQRGDEKSVAAELRMLPGSLSVASNPPGAALSVNDKPYGSTPVVIKNLTPGKYSLQLRQEGYDPYNQTVVVSPGQRTEVSYDLDSNRGGVDVVVHPPGVTIYLDGVRQGMTKPGESEDLSEVFELRELGVGKHTLKFAHKRATPPDKTIKVNVRKGETSRVGPFEMWIADTVLTLKDGTEMTGRLKKRDETRKMILFEPEPHIAQRYGFNEIETVKPLRLEE